MSSTSDYTPPTVWTWNKANGGRFANINRPIAGPTHDKELPVGRHPLQLYSLGTPNGVKVTIMLEELLALGHTGAEYDAWLIRIGEGDQFGSGFVAVNPNSKIPALIDRSGPKPDPRVRVRRDPALPRREVRRVPADGRRRARRMPVLAVLADGQRALPRRRLRPLLCLCADQDRIRHRPLRHGDQAAARRARPAAGREPSIWPATTTRSPTWRSGPGTAAWPRACCTARGEFLSVQDYKNVQRWTDAIGAAPGGEARPHGQPPAGDPASQLHERHDASDFELEDAGQAGRQGVVGSA